MTNQYRFDSKNHYHQLLVNGEWKPLIGTSSVLSIIAKPLVWWSSGLAVKEFGCPDPKVLTKMKNKKATKDEIADLNVSAAGMMLTIQRMNIDDYIKLLDRAYRAHATNLKDTAETGVDLHSTLSDFVRYRMGTFNALAPWPTRIEPFIRWTDKNVEKFCWSEVHCFSRKWHLGGISDCGFIDKQGRMGILDFKSARSAYLEMFWQCAGYDLQISENGGFDADGNQTLDPNSIDSPPADYYAVLPFGMEEPTVQVREDVAECRENFLHALALYRAFPRD